MRVAIMQPYIFPYAPYFQLVYAVDCFVFLDTVQYIRRGWMNRNRIRLDGRDHLFTIPVAVAPRETPISDIVFAANAGEEATSLSTKLRHAYGRAAHWSQVERLVLPLLQRVRPGASFADFTCGSLTEIATALGIETRFVRASDLAERRAEHYQDYIIDMCRELEATEYVNPLGGTALYSHEAFTERSIRLSFLKSSLEPYPQVGEGFIENLSIIDTMANCALTGIAASMPRYSLDTSA